MRKVLLEQYIKYFLKNTLIKENRPRPIDVDAAFPPESDENEAIEDENEAIEDENEAIEDENEITWGDLIDIIKCKINSKRTAKVAKFAFRSLGGALIEDGISIGAEGVEKSIEVSGKISKAIVSYTSEALEETTSNAAFSVTDLNENLKRFFKKIGSSSVNTFASIIFSIYQCKESNSEIKSSDLKYLVIDEQLSEIIEDGIEIKFLKDMSKKILQNEGSIKDKKVKDTNINDLLKEFLEINYKNRTVTGY